MWIVKFTAPEKKNDRVHFMDFGCFYGEHLGMLGGGSYNTKTGVGEFIFYCHPDDDCPCNNPRIKRITPKIKSRFLKTITALGATIHKA